MATADEQAILDEGLTLAQFPALERDADYLVNYYLTTTDLVLIQENVWPVEGDASGVVAVTATASQSFEVISEATVDPSADAQASADFLIEHAATISADSLIQYAHTVQIEHSGEFFSVEPAYATVNSTFEIQSFAEANNPAFVRGDVLNIPVWTFEPNWSDSVTQTLEWLTDVMTSPRGAEQRRALRQYPRRMLEYNLIVDGARRQFFDHTVVSYGAFDMYVPAWQEVDLLSIPADPGALELVCAGMDLSAIREDGIITLYGEDPFRVELVEVAGVAGDVIQLRTSLVQAWDAGTRVFPTYVMRMTDQPTPSRKTDSVSTVTVKFQMQEPGKNVLPPSPVALEEYRGFGVFDVAPDESRDLTAGYERMLVHFDNRVALPSRRDTAARAFTVQQHGWMMGGRAELRRFEALLYHMKGKVAPLWLPTFQQDFVLAAPIATDATTITVEGAGFTITGGPRPERQDIMIETSAGTFYRRITNTALDSLGREVLLLDSPIAVGLQVSQVYRICFMVLMRLNQDSVSIDHHTDTHGATAALANFRSAPDLRVPTAGF